MHEAEVSPKKPGPEPASADEEERETIHPDTGFGAVLQLSADAGQMMIEWMSFWYACPGHQVRRF